MVSSTSEGTSRVPASVEAVFFGESDPRIRASWRLVLSWVLLFVWNVVTALVAGGTSPLWDTLPGPAQQLLTISIGTAIFLAMFAVFARYVDRRTLSGYGLTWSRTWVAELGVGFLAVFLGTALWTVLGVVLGWTSVDLVLGASDLGSMVWLVALLVPWYLSGLTQSLLSVGLVTKNGAEGLDCRGLPLAYAATGAVAVAVLFFALRHTPTTATGFLSLVFGGVVFTLLYVHSGNLALSIGAIGSANYTNQFVFRNTDVFGGAENGVYVFQLSTSFPEVVEVVARTNLPTLVVTYLLVAGWLTWQRDGLRVHPSLTEWRPP